MRIRSFAPVHYAVLAVLLAAMSGCDSGTEPVEVEEEVEQESFPTICEPRGALSVPDTVQERLVSSECVLSQRYIDVWALDVDADLELTIDLIGDDFDPTLALLDADGQTIVRDDDGGLGYNSRVNREFASGRYYLYASSFSEYTSGDYRLSVHEGPPVSPCPPTATLAFPDTVTGSVTASACDFDGFYVDAWRLELPMDTTVMLELETVEFEPVILLADPSGDFIEYGSQLSGRAWLEVPLSAGSYDIWVSDAYRRGQTGSYTLEVRGGPQALLCAAAGTIAVGETVQGEIAGEACGLGYSHGEAWDLELTDRTEIAVSVHGDVRSPYILIFDESGRDVGGAWGDGFAAAADLELGPGTYRVWVLADLGSQGAYTLTVRDGPTWSSCPAAGTIAPGEAVQGKITSEDCILDYAQGDPWELELADSADLAMSVEGELMYPYLQVIDAQGHEVEYGFGDESSAALDVTLGGGAYRVWVLGPQEPDLQGTYTLSVWDAGSTPTCDAAGTVTPGDTVAGALSSTDCGFPDGRYGDLWTMPLDSSATIAIRLTSDKIDPYLVVADSAGSVIAEDDDGGSGFNAALTIELDAGWYQVWTTSYAPGEVGAYELNLELAEASSPADPDLAGEVAGKGAAPDAWGAPTPLRPARREPPSRVPPVFSRGADKADVLDGGR